MVCSRETSVLEEPGWICDCTKAGACISRNKMLAVCRNELHLGDSRRTGLEIPLICWAVLIMQVLSEICLFVFLNTCPAWLVPDWADILWGTCCCLLFLSGNLEPLWFLLGSEVTGRQGFCSSSFSCHRRESEGLQGSRQPRATSTLGYRMGKWSPSEYSTGLLHIIGVGDGRRQQLLVHACDV